MKIKKTLPLLFSSLILFAIPSYMGFTKSEVYNQNHNVLKNTNEDIPKLVDGFTEMPYAIMNKALSDDYQTIVILAEGFRQNEQDIFLQRAKWITNSFFKIDHYKKLKPYINIYAIPIVSNQKSTIYQKRDTFFEVKGHGSDYRRLLPSPAGRMKALSLAQQIKNNILKTKNNIYPHIVLNTTEHGGIAYGNYAVSALNTHTFSHEQSHLFGMADEYDSRYFRDDNKYFQDPNASSTSDVDKLPWKEFIGYNNIGFRKSGTKYIPSNEKKCAMEVNTSYWCEVCKYFIFKNVTSKFKDKMVYYGTPSITEAFDDTNPNEFNKPRVVLSKGNLGSIDNKFIETRTYVDNPTNNNIKVKLTFEYNNSNNPDYNQQKEEIFELKPGEKKLLKIKSDNQAKFLTAGENTYMESKLYDITNGDENLIESSLTYSYSEPKKDTFKSFNVNFIDNATRQKLEFIDSNTYYYKGSDNYINKFNQIDIKGYKKVRSTRNGDQINWYYEKLNTKKMNLTLRQTIDNSIVSKKEWNIVKGETFTPSKHDFLLSNYTDKKIVGAETTVNYEDVNLNLEYYIYYTSYTTAVKEYNIVLKQGEDYPEDNVYITCKNDNGEEVFNKIMSENILIDYGNFDKK